MDSIHVILVEMVEQNSKVVEMVWKSCGNGTGNYMPLITRAREIK